MENHPKKFIVILLILVVILSGCSSLATLNLSFDSEERQYLFYSSHYKCDENPSEFLAIPHVYSGAKNDLIMLVNPYFCGWAGGEVGMINNAFYILFWPVIALDCGLSVAGDTLLLPYTIPIQFTKGNLIDPPYFAIGQKYHEAGNDNKALRYYEKGVQILPKYYDDNIEAERSFFDLDSIFFKMAELYEKKQNYAKSIYFYDELIELTKASHGNSGYDLERYFRRMGDVYKKAGNAVKANECYKTAKEYKKLAKEEYENYLKKKYGNQPQKKKEEVSPGQSVKKENKLPSSFVIDNGKLVNQELIPLNPLPTPETSPEKKGEEGKSVKKF